MRKIGFVWFLGGIAAPLCALSGCNGAAVTCFGDFCVTTVPADGATNVPATTSLIYEFSKPVIVGTFVIVLPDGSSVIEVVEGSDTRIELVVSFVPNALQTVTMRDLQTADGAVQIDEFSFSFTTQ